jgi:hypothetical protein
MRVDLKLDLLLKFFEDMLCLNVNRENADSNVLQLYQCRKILDKLIIEILFWNQEFAYCVCCSPPVDHALSQLQPIDTVSSLFRIHLDDILLSTLGFLNGYVP